MTAQGVLSHVDAAADESRVPYVERAELLAASQPSELDRFGAGAEAAAKAFSEERPDQ